MAENERPLGRAYHEVYLPPSPMQGESHEFRVRYAYLLRKLEHYDLSDFVIGETAIEGFRPSHTSDPIFRNAIVSMSWLDLLKVIYAVGDYLENTYSVSTRREYIENVQRLFVSERLNWEMDNYGGIQPLRDAAYAVQRQSVIAGLSVPRFANAAAAMERFVAAYDSAQPDNKLAVNHVFDAAEALFKLRYQPTPPDRLTMGTAGQYLSKDFAKPKAQHEEQSHLKRANSAMVAGFADWVEACQQYRHEQGQPDSDEQPPAELAELLVSAGMSYVRWLVRIDPGA